MIQACKLICSVNAPKIGSCMWHTQFIVFSPLPLVCFFLVHTHSLFLSSGSSWSSMYLRDSQLSLGSSHGTGQWECVLCLYCNCASFALHSCKWIEVCVSFDFSLNHMSFFTGTWLKDVEFCYSQLYHSVFWGRGSPLTTGLELHSGWLFGKYCSTVLSVTKSTDSHFLLFPLDLCMQVRQTTSVLTS